jgi:hypothetical protein
MPDVSFFREAALAFPGVIESPHFHRTSFRSNKKIFATLDETAGVGVLLLSPEEQDLFSLHDPDAVHAVPNKWGKKGATEVVLKLVKKKVLREAMKIAWERVQPGKKG